MRAYLEMLLNQNFSVVSLFEKADRSTFLRFMARLYVESRREISLLVDAPAWVIENVQTLTKWLGIGCASDAVEDKFATAVEAYLMDGIAPSKEITYVFEDFRYWLCDIYKEMEQIKSLEISDDIRGLISEAILSRHDGMQVLKYLLTDPTATLPITPRPRGIRRPAPAAGCVSTNNGKKGGIVSG